MTKRNNLTALLLLYALLDDNFCLNFFNIHLYGKTYTTVHMCIYQISVGAMLHIISSRHRSRALGNIHIKHQNEEKTSL